MDKDDPQSNVGHNRLVRASSLMWLLASFLVVTAIVSSGTVWWVNRTLKRASIDTVRIPEKDQHAGQMEHQTSDTVISVRSLEEKQHLLFLRVEALSSQLDKVTALPSQPVVGVKDVKLVDNHAEQQALRDKLDRLQKKLAKTQEMLIGVQKEQRQMKVQMEHTNRLLKVTQEMLLEVRNRGR